MHPKILHKIDKILKTAWEEGIDIRAIGMSKDLRSEIDNAKPHSKTGFNYGKNAGFGSVDIIYY